MSEAEGVMNLLPEDPEERRYFDDTVNAFGTSPLMLVENGLRIMHSTAEYPNSSYAKLLAIYANEVAKARAMMTPNAIAHGREHSERPAGAEG